MLKDIKWPVVIISFVLTLAALYFINNWRISHLIDEPLKKSLEANPQVKSVEMLKRNDTVVFTVQLTNVSDFKATYNDLRSEIENFIGDKEYHLFFQSNDDGNDDNNLSRFYNEIHLFLYEAARTGNYIVAKEELAQIAHEMGIINYQFQVDEKRIYFFAEKDGSILCKTIELEENRV
ncbi:MAG: hypothetical protein GX767_05320 [Firmicutes bacterium]|nr:hypothetical protein [Bacillota bacterium]